MLARTLRDFKYPGLGSREAHLRTEEAMRLTIGLRTEAGESHVANSGDFAPTRVLL